MAEDLRVAILSPRETYTKVYNLLAADNRLRLQTRMLLVIMLSKPQDWDFSVRGLAVVADVTKDTVSRMLRELEEAGYIRRNRQLREGGRFGKAGLLVSPVPVFTAEGRALADAFDARCRRENAALFAEAEEACSEAEAPTEEENGVSDNGENNRGPRKADRLCGERRSDGAVEPGSAASRGNSEVRDDDSPCPKNQDTETSPCPDSSYTKNSPQEINKQVIIPPYSPPRGGTASGALPGPQGGTASAAPPKKRRRGEARKAPDWKPDRFEGFWSYYPAEMRKDKQLAMDEWDRLQPDDELIDEIAKALRRQKASRMWREGVGIPYPGRYLRKRRWEEADHLPEETQPAGWSWAPDPEVL